MSDNPEYEFIVCANCGVQFGMPTILISSRRKDGESIFCPNGHSLSFGDGENEKLRQELEYINGRLSEDNEEIIGQKKQISTLKGQLTKLKNRISND